MSSPPWWAIDDTPSCRKLRRVRGAAAVDRRPSWSQAHWGRVAHLVIYTSAAACCCRRGYVTRAPATQALCQVSPHACRGLARAAVLGRVWAELARIPERPSAQLAHLRLPCSAMCGAAPSARMTGRAGLPPGCAALL